MKGFSVSLSLRAPLSLGKTHVFDLIESTQGYITEHQFSSLYKRYFSERKEALNAEYILVCRANTQLNASDFIQWLSAHPFSQQLSLLCFDHLVRLVPGSPLPHPSLADDPLVLLCMAEVSPNLSHPILKRPYVDLAKQHPTGRLIEFVGQAQDFYKARAS